MALYPKPIDKTYDIPGLHIPSDDPNSRGTGSDTTDKSHILYIGSAPLERVVGFKAFIESFKINLQKEKEIVSPNNQNRSYIKEKEGSLSYNLSLNVPAHSTNEAVNNMAKIEELQRLIVMPDAGWTVAASTATNSDGTRTDSISSIGVSSLSNTTLPLFYVFFKNLINSGAAFTSDKIYDFKDLMKKGFTCYIENIKYDPDVDAGYFKLNGDFYPRNIKLSLSLIYESETLFSSIDGNVLNRRIIMPYELNGRRHAKDSGLFPFHSDITGKDEFNNINSDDLRNLERKNYLFIGKDFGEEQQEASATTTTNTTQPAQTIIGQAGGAQPTPTTTTPTEEQPTSENRYVVFDLFLESFSRDLKYTHTKKDAGNSSIYSRITEGGTKFEALTYSVKINVPSENLREAKKNAKKMQVLMRLFYKLYADGTSLSTVSKEDQLQKLMVYIPSMIEKPGAGSKQKYASGMFKNAIPLFLEELSFDIDMEQGFFEEKSKMYPKSFSVDFKFLYNKSNAILNYSMSKKDGVNNYYFEQPTTPDFVTADNAFLFPFNEKTVTIGKKPS